MLTWTNINTKQIIRWGIAIVFGSLIAICVDFVLSYYRPIDWGYCFSCTRIVAVALGSMFSGILSRKYGWLTGAIIAVIHFMCITSVLFPPSPFIAKIHWSSILPTGIFMIITGLIFGYLGGKLRKGSSGGHNT